MKRVVAFFDMFDEIPDNATYLFSRKAEPSSMPAKENATPETESAASNVSAENIKASIYIHYYEVDDMDFENLMDEDSPFVKESNVEKMKKFIQKYKIPTS